MFIINRRSAGWLSSLALAICMLLPSIPALAAGPVLHVLVSYGPAADGYPSAYNGRFIQLQPDQSGYGGKTVATVSANVLVLLDHVDAGAARQPSALIAELKGDIAARANLIAASMVAQMRGQNSPTGVMEFKQDVLLPNNQKGVLAWRMMVDSSGAMRYGDPEVLPEEALTLDVVYTPLSLSAALPATWPRYADAGLLKWRLIDKTGTARTAWTSVDAAGAFDNPESMGGGAVDPDAGLKCLILDRTQCGGPIDIKTLMDQQGAAAAYVAYTRRLAPVYDDVADPAHPGEFLRRARISLSVDSRELTYNGCGQALTYRNQGAYGFTLAARSEKYLVDANLRYYPVDWVDETRISPTEPYDKSASVARTEVATIGAMIISPRSVGNELVYAANVDGISYLAPVIQSGSDGTSPVNWWIQFLPRTNGWPGVPSWVWTTTGYSIACDGQTGEYIVAAGILDNGMQMGVHVGVPGDIVKTKVVNGYDQNAPYVTFVPGIRSTAVASSFWFALVDICDQSCVATYVPSKRNVNISIEYDGVSTFTLSGWPIGNPEWPLDQIVVHIQ